MKELLSLLLLILPSMIFAQQIDNNEQDGFMAKGYDVVAYFEGGVKKGKMDYKLVHEGANYKFNTAKNLAAFQANPAKYIPQFGGWCAYAMANEQKVEIDPESYEIRDGKLYLFYKSYFSSAFKKWKAEGPAALAIKAGDYWERVKYRK